MKIPTWYDASLPARGRLIACWEAEVHGAYPVTEFLLPQAAGRLTKTGRRPAAWRFDLAWPNERILVEINGYGFGHLTVAQVARDALKSRDAIADGYLPVVFTSKCLGSFSAVMAAVEYLQQLVAKRHALIQFTAEIPQEEVLLF